MRKDGPGSRGKKNQQRASGKRQAPLILSSIDTPSSLVERAKTQGLSSLKITAGLRSLLINGAEPGHPVQGHAGAVTLLVHAGDAIAIGDQVLGHDV